MNHRMARWSLPIALGMLVFVTGSVFTTESLAQQSGRASRRDADRTHDAEHREPAAPRPADSEPPREPRSVRAEITVFRVALAEEKLVDLDAVALAASADTPAALRSALETLGKVDALYRIDQRALEGGRGSRTQLSRDVPYIKSTHKQEGGPPLPALARNDVAMSINYNVRLDAAGERVHTEVNIDLSMATASSVPVGDNVHAPVFWKARQTFGGSSALGEPIVIISADNANTEQSPTGFAYVTLVRFSK